MDRRLASIMAADMVGYSLRTRVQETATLGDLMAVRHLL